MKTIQHTLIALALIVSMRATGQTDAKATLAVMDQELITMQTSLSQIDGNIKKDKHKEMEKEIHSFNDALVRFETKSLTLSQEYSFGEQIKSVKSSSEAFEKIVHKSSLFDKDKELNKQFVMLKSNVNNLKSYFNDVKSLIESNMEVSHQKDHDQINNEYKAILDTALSKILPLNTNIKTQLSKITVALKKNDYGDVAHHAGEVIKLCDKMLPYLSYLNEKEKNALTISINSTKKEATSLQTNAKKGAANHEDVHHHFGKLELEANSLNAQLALLK